MNKLKDQATIKDQVAFNSQVAAKNQATFNSQAVAKNQATAKNQAAVNNQVALKGQAAVEFAIIAPLFFMMCFGLIYAGILFMDYLQYNNAARAIARYATIESVDKLNEHKSDVKETFIKPTTNLYVIENTNDDFQILKTKNGKEIAETNSGEGNSVEDVTVIIKLKLNSDLPRILWDIGFPPKELKPIVYTMSKEPTIEE